MYVPISKRRESDSAEVEGGGEVAKTKRSAGAIAINNSSDPAVHKRLEEYCENCSDQHAPRFLAVPENQSSEQELKPSPEPTLFSPPEPIVPRLPRSISALPPVD